MPRAGIGAAATQLDALLAAIPIAQDDNVITRDYHNSLRAALLALAEEIGGGPVSAAGTLTLAPAFLPNQGGPNWNMENGTAIRGSTPDGAQRLAGANGWMPVQLPDKVRIQSMTVVGRRSGTITSFIVALVRSSIAEGSNPNIITLQLKEAEDPFERTGTPAINVSGSNVPVDNSAFKYFVTAKLIGAADADDVAEIRAIRITYQTV